MQTFDLALAEDYQNDAISLYLHLKKSFSQYNLYKIIYVQII